MTEEKKNYNQLTFSTVQTAYETLRNSDALQEPLPSFDTADEEKVHSVLGTIYARFDGQVRFTTISREAAACLYLINKSHPFHNGNKRMSVLLSALILAMNGYVLDVHHEELARVAADVARRAGGSDMEEDIERIARWLEEHMVVGSA